MQPLWQAGWVGDEGEGERGTKIFSHVIGLSQGRISTPPGADGKGTYQKVSVSGLYKSKDLYVIVSSIVDSQILK